MKIITLKRIRVEKTEVGKNINTLINKYKN
jgi:hypothetical protein